MNWADFHNQNKQKKTSFIIDTHFGVKNSDTAEEKGYDQKYLELIVILDSCGLPIIRANVQSGSSVLFFINILDKIQNISAGIFCE